MRSALWLLVALACGCSSNVIAPGTDAGPSPEVDAGPPPDRDGDGVDDDHDNCPVTANADQADANHNSIGDACENTGAPDQDCDGRPDSADNCPAVWNVSQLDDDRDGLGNPCDMTPRGERPLPWTNGTFARAFAKWFDEVRCTLNNCQDPSGLGSWNASCSGGGSVAWNISTSGFRGISVFTYSNCAHEVMVTVHDYAADPLAMNPNATTTTAVTLVVDGTFTQNTDFSGNGGETGTVNVTGGFTGAVTSSIVLVNKVRGAGSSYATACSAGSVTGEACAPNMASVAYDFPDWSCAPGSCPAPPAPLVDGDGDGVFDPYDDCPSIANADQADVDFDGQGDACDATPGQCTGALVDGGLPELDAGVEDAGVPDAGASFTLLKVKMGRCLFDNGNGGVSSTGSCDGTKVNQQWDVIDVAPGQRAFKNHQTSQCLTAVNWAGTIGMGTCGVGAATWKTERYDQGGFDTKFPMRLRASTQNWCLYTDGTGLVYASQGNCDLLGTQDNRKVGLYAGGDFTATPTQP